MSSDYDLGQLFVWPVAFGPFNLDVPFHLTGLTWGIIHWSDFHWIWVVFVFILCATTHFTYYSMLLLQLAGLPYNVCILAQGLLSEFIPAFSTVHLCSQLSAFCIFGEVCCLMPIFWLFCLDFLGLISVFGGHFLLYMCHLGVQSLLWDSVPHLLQPVFFDRGMILFIPHLAICFLFERASL